ncbi:MAG TPA: CsbD family protein [Burkholderiaceae bacterium]|nr:CsbD family protein [Burkholderiaceae bacterium]
MNRDQVKGAAKDAAGKVQRKTGEALGSPRQEAKGAARQVEGKTQKRIGDAKEAISDASRPRRTRTMSR